MSLCVICRNLCLNALPSRSLIRGKEFDRHPPKVMVLMDTMPSLMRKLNQRQKNFPKLIEFPQIFNRMAQNRGCARGSLLYLSLMLTSSQNRTTIKLKINLQMGNSERVDHRNILETIQIVCPNINLQIRVKMIQGRAMHRLRICMMSLARSLWVLEF